MISHLNNSVGHQELNALKWFAVFSKGHLDNFIEDKLSQLNVSSEVFAKFEYVKKKNNVKNLKICSDDVSG